ncbi:MAG: EAL domain-containing protein [Lacisediminimonas sp.]|nr:EAL domain-containing protein [Lacisediminimonas sp.]
MSAPHEDAEGSALPEILSAIRQHLRMDVAFVSEFKEGRRVYRTVDAADGSSKVREGASDPLGASYCQRVVDGRLPPIMHDARKNPEAASLPISDELHIAAHLAVPLRLSDGSIYGTLCAFSYSEDDTLNERDLEMMQVFAELAARMIEREQRKIRLSRDALKRIHSVLAHANELSIVYQPIFNLREQRMAGVEALSRFSALPQRSPDVWFHEASVVGLGGDLEKMAAQAALRCLDQLPQDIYLSVNMSPEYVLDGTLATVLEGMPLHRVTLEITEHSAIVAYHELAQRLKPLRERGLQVAIDDAGAGYASFRHILNLAPERIKLDISITKNIDSDASRRALGAAFSRFAQEIGSKLIAEGVETREELATLQSLGVVRAQGNFLSAALPLAGVLSLPVKRAFSRPGQT